MKYKKHIDGLRVFAVIPVVLFHLDLSFFSGGYIGVDIFFVISGFLITSILFEDIVSGKYSLIEFYKRRILRILPALFFMLVSVAILSYIVYLPAEQIDVGVSILSATLFISNIFFWLDSGYFSAAAETKPLLHTWSLAVEEQFYILFPPLLYLIVKYARAYSLYIIAALSFASLIACIIFTYIHQPTAFYMLPTRAWELGMGAFLAILLRLKPALKGDNIFLAGAGMAMILGSIFLLDSTSIFPGWNAFFPCLGALLLIGWAEGNAVGKLLSQDPLVWIGKMSYSFYLWHWPLIVFWKAYSGENLNAYEMTLLGFGSLAMGAFSTYVMEKPFRSSKARQLAARRVVSGGVIAMIAMSVLGVATMQNLIELRTYPQNVREISSYLQYREQADYDAQFRKGSCFITRSEVRFSAYERSLCSVPDADRPNVLLIGDSHAAQYWGAMNEAFANINTLQATASGCRFLLNGDGAARCTDMRDWVFDTYLPEANIDTVILAGRWQENELELIAPTVRYLNGLVSTVIVIGPTVEYEAAFPLLLARSIWRETAFDFNHTLTPGKPALGERIKTSTLQAGGYYIDVISALSTDQGFRLMAPDGGPMQFDYGHLTLSGARFVVDQYRSDLLSMIGGIQ